MTMPLSFQPLAIDLEHEVLADWLSSDRWPYHVHPQLSHEAVRRWIEQGEFAGTECQTVWIVAEPLQRVGLIRLFDLDDIGDGAPQFDLRVQSAYRGQGIGQAALEWLTQYLFKTWPELERIEGTTRVDNIPMRKVFSRCNYVKEGHFRKAWKTIDGRCLDAVSYGILRDDWLNQTTTPVDWNDGIYCSTGKS